MDQARAWKHDKDLSNRLTDQAVGLLGRVLTEGQTSTETAESASQIPADCNPEVYDEGFWSRVDAWPASSALPDPPPLCRHPRCPGRSDGLARAAGYSVVAASGLGCDEDEQA
jgi:hypothetical protein